MRSSILVSLASLALTALTACAMGTDEDSSNEETSAMTGVGQPTDDGSGGNGTSVSTGTGGNDDGSQVGTGTGGSDNGWPTGTGASDNGTGSTAGSGGSDDGTGGTGDGECEDGDVLTCTTTCGSSGTSTCKNRSWGSCKPPSQETSCYDNVDNDCDGNADEQDADCQGLHTCEETHGGNCNTDLGYGDKCAPSDNWGGCSEEKFWAWCNRQNDQYPNIWENWIRNWVDSNCDGEVIKGTQQYPIYTCTDSNNATWECQTPLVLSFDNAPVSFLPSEHGFALASDIGDRKSDWPSAATPWLALDRNDNGLVDDGSELFGSASMLSSGSTATQGFEALADFDDNNDGVIDASDAVWSRLLVWRDGDHNGMSSAGELNTVAAEGLVRISLQYSVAPRCDARGNCERERAEFVWSDGASEHIGTVIDVHLRLHSAVCE